jgi:hypothetical protein
MEPKTVIAALTHSDPSIWSDAIDVCELCQTPGPFDFETCADLISPGQLVYFRIFGFNSLRFITSVYWGAIEFETPF